MDSFGLVAVQRFRTSLLTASITAMTHLPMKSHAFYIRVTAEYAFSLHIYTPEVWPRTSPRWLRVVDKLLVPVLAGQN